MITQGKNNLYEKMLSDIDIIRKDKKLLQEKNFISRSEAIEYIDFHIIDQIDFWIRETGQTYHLQRLRNNAEETKQLLEEVNLVMFHRLRTGISQEVRQGRLLMNLIYEYLDMSEGSVEERNKTGYDHLDLFINGIINHQPPPAESKTREPEMVFYQKTPVRIVLELIKRADLKPQDVFFDLGSGLGQATILINLLTSIVSKGVEFEPAFCKYARSCAAKLNLDRVEFLEEDAREADYSTGTVFFMYTPFEGKMLQDVLQKLQEEAKNRKIRIFTYGPCTTEVQKKEWLLNKKNAETNAGLFGEFISI